MECYAAVHQDSGVTILQTQTYMPILRKCPSSRTAREDFGQSYQVSLGPTNFRISLLIGSLPRNLFSFGNKAWFQRPLASNKAFLNSNFGTLEIVRLVAKGSDRKHFRSRTKAEEVLNLFARQLEPLRGACGLAMGKGFLRAVNIWVAASI